MADLLFDIDPTRPINVVMLLFPGFTVLDLIGPQTALGHHTDVHLVARTLDPVTSDSGPRMLPSCTFETCPEQIDVLFVPGGYGTANVMNDEETISFLRERGKTAKVIASVCSGSMIQGAAGLIKGYKATTHWAHLDDLAALGAEPVRARVVIDRNRISGGGVTAGLDFGLQLLAALRGEETARVMELMMEYDPEPPFKTGTPRLAGADITAIALTALDEAVTDIRAAAARRTAAILAEPEPA